MSRRRYRPLTLIASTATVLGALALLAEPWFPSNSTAHYALDLDGGSLLLVGLVLWTFVWVVGS